VDGRIDPFIVDLAAFHPPGYCVVDGIRGLQYEEHGAGISDQEVRSNIVLAGEDPVAVDATVASLIGMNPWDIDYLHLAQRRGMGTLNASSIDIIGDEPDRLRRYWARPQDWFGRCNREWRLSANPQAPLETWRKEDSPTDTLRAPCRAGEPFAAAVRVVSGAAGKGFLWVGARGEVAASLNGRQVLRANNETRYRIGQFQAPVDLLAGENLLRFDIRPNSDTVALSALISGARNDGDTLEGIHWQA